MDELDLIDKVDALLRNKLNGTTCVICGYHVVDGLIDGSWSGNHSPYIEVNGDEIVAGYRCKKDPGNPVIVFRISRSRGGRGGTTVYE